MTLFRETEPENLVFFLATILTEKRKPNVRQAEACRTFGSAQAALCDFMDLLCTKSKSHPRQWVDGSDPAY